MFENFKRFIVLQGMLRLGPGGVRCCGNAWDSGSQPVPWKQWCAGGSQCLDVTRSWDSCPQVWHHMVKTALARRTTVPVEKHCRVENEKLHLGSDEYM